MTHNGGEFWVGWMDMNLCVALITQDKSAKGKLTLETEEALADTCHPRGIGPSPSGLWTSVFRVHLLISHEKAKFKDLGEIFVAWYQSEKTGSGHAQFQRPELPYVDSDGCFLSISEQLPRLTA